MSCKNENLWPEILATVKMKNISAKTHTHKYHAVNEMKEVYEKFYLFSSSPQKEKRRKNKMKILW
jgi:hypothetical protein